MVFYKSYPYAPKATILSALAAIGTYLGVIGAIALFAAGFKGMLWMVFVGIALLAGSAALYFVIYRKIVPEKAKVETEQNIATKANFAAMYCKQHPEAYDELIKTNPDFAAKYIRNEAGKIVKQR